jgi:hypothetical protein
MKIFGFLRVFQPLHLYHRVSAWYLGIANASERI